MKLIRALPDVATSFNKFTEQETVGIADDFEGVPMGIAQSHCMLSQTRCSIVKEQARGPKGGRGSFHYNAGPDWPASWRRNKLHRYYIVLEVMPKGTSTKVSKTDHPIDAYAKLLGMDYAKEYGDDVIGECVVEESSTFNVEAWKKLPYNKR